MQPNKSLQLNNSHFSPRLRTASFTLIELLIVIGILAILTAAVVIVLNPTELLKQGRDSTRMTDLASLSKTIQLLLTQNPSLSLGTASTVYISLPDTSATCANLSLPTLPIGYTYHCVPTASSTLLNSSGWLPIDFTSSIQSLPRLPIDPTNTSSTGLYYTYVSNSISKTYELTASVESSKYVLRGSADGGMSSLTFEAGNDLSLTPSILLGRGGTYTQFTMYDPSLVGYWKLDEGSGLNVFDSKNTNTGVITGATWTSGANCKVGNCLVFSSTLDTKVRGTLSPTIPIDGSYTQLMWIYPMLASTAYVFDDYNNAEHYLIFNSNGTINGGYYNNDTGPVQLNVSTSGAIPLNTWSFIAVSIYSRNYIRVYINGVLEAERTNLNNLPTRLLDDFVLGQIGGGGGSRLEGRIDEVMLYRRSLSSGEIASLYNAMR